ncbi:hypothetical protein J7T55_009622 [Diaporthe amygdali]|uniref:uncharacterized protein n=1 Tax=Phomopsis amygdali TaxID=1214568 RepID=UPI0022FF3354|nr:uncharacterized protein J7T55_009622 [Diaporthe amygdali]KAJ0109290.1 hypothetical protein J7T55_009622 [Diaporthe amygdali]
MAPKKATAKSPKSKSTPSRQSKPEVVELSSDENSSYDDIPDLDAEAAQDEEAGDDSEPQPEAVTPARKGGKRKAAEEDEDESPNAKKAKVSSVKISKSESGSSGKKHTHRNVKVEIPVSTPVTKPAGKHIVFNDDDGPAEFFTPQEAPAQNLLDVQLSKGDAEGDAKVAEDDEESDSDDEAPEAVSSHTAAAQAAKSAQAATRAAEKQSELQRRKRQERDARLKQQAETRKKKQGVPDKKAAAEAAEVSPEPAQKTDAPTRKRLDRRALPDMLPDDFLEAASEDEEDDEEGDSDDGNRKPRKAKFNTVAKQVAKAESRRPQDQRVGSTVYRVVRKQDDTSLAPKLGKYSRHDKELLLRRGRPVARKGGFLVKRR